MSGVEAVAWVTDADVRDFGCGDGESVFLFAKSGKWNRPLYSQATVDTLRAQLEARAREELRILGQRNVARDQVAKLHELLEVAEARAEAAETDAARYRWLRVNEQGRCDAFLADAFEDLDAAIDAAIARTKEETK